MKTTSASAQASGYIYQFQHALLRLFSSQASDVTIGIETEDDVVAIEHKGGQVQIEFVQSKLTFQDAHVPIGDRSHNLWHSLEIWLQLRRDKAGLPIALSFCFVTNKDVPASALVRRLAAADSPAELAAAVNQLRVSGLTLSGKAKASATNVLQYTDEELSRVVRDMRLLDGADVTGSDGVAAQTIALFHLTTDLVPKAQQIYQALLGELIDTCIQAWHGKQPALVHKLPFAQRLQAEKDLHRRLRLCEQPWMNIDFKKYLTGANCRHFFLKQIEHLQVGKKNWNKAIESYWGFYAERARLLEIGDMLPQDFDERNALLFDRWETIVNNVEIAALDEEEDPACELTQRKKARAVYAKTIDGEFCAPLRDQTTRHPYFTIGNYHHMAEHPDTEHFVYWHAAFKPENA
jgi:hypothetical protein